MGRPRKRAKVAQSNPAEPNVSAQCDETAPTKDMISTLPSEILDKIFKNLLPEHLPIVIDELTRWNPGAPTFLNLLRLMSVSRKFNKSATEVFWKNAYVEVVLIHSDAHSSKPKTTALKAFMVEWTSTKDCNNPSSWKNLEQQTLAAYLCKARTVRFLIRSRYLKGSQRRLTTRSDGGDLDFQRHAQYFLSALRAAGKLTKLDVIIRPDCGYMADVWSKKTTKSFRWHLDVLELFKFCGVQLEVRTMGFFEEEVQIKEASVVSYIQELQTLALKAEVSKPAPMKRKRYTKAKVEKPAAVKVEIEEDP
ncbi:hypothetical protein E2P81_ATG11648 [Venturia nashicola]|nr:hypothetical protein E2P81_ATG11648 [Venturia nashicola]